MEEGLGKYMIYYHLRHFLSVLFVIKKKMFYFLLFVNQKDRINLSEEISSTKPANSMDSLDFLLPSFPISHSS